MKSIQTKFITLILSGMLLMALVISSASVFVTNEAIDRDSAQIMGSLCEEKAVQIEKVFDDIENAVDIIAVYAYEQLGDVQALVNDQAYRDEYTQKIENLAVSITENTEDSIAVYYRYNPDIMPPAEGFFWSRNEIGGEITKFPNTDLSQFGEDEEDKAKWYYLPVHNEAPLWISPYMNHDVDEYMVSYVVPLYKENVLIGVIGMDIELNLIIQTVDSIKVYDSGFAFLTDENDNVVYHKDFEIGTAIKANSGGVKSETVTRELPNGMKLVITVPVSEIDAVKTAIIKRSVIAAVLISMFFIIITVVLTHRITNPLKKLTAVTEKVSKGQFDVEFPESRADEIGVLSESIQKMVGYLKEYITCINELIYSDSLTGLKNKAAYQETVHRLEREISSSKPSFAVIVMDVNWLKAVNDNYGHELGDMLLKNTAKLISETFDKKSVYRIGGDEFAVILENEETEQAEALVEKFKQVLKEQKQRAETVTEKISVAAGMAVYQSEEDNSFHSVFKRADKNMYDDKEETKKNELY